MQYILRDTRKQERKEKLNPNVACKSDHYDLLLGFFEPVSLLGLLWAGSEFHQFSWRNSCRVLRVDAALACMYVCTCVHTHGA